LVAAAVMNTNPREAFLRASADTNNPSVGMMQRAAAAHNNMLECLPWYLGALLFAMAAGVPTKNVDAVAVYYVVARTAYILLYIFGSSPRLALCRTLTFFTLLGSCLYLFCHAASLAPAPKYS
jgi:uncharacterized MAPEG superfamily protein